MFYINYWWKILVFVKLPNLTYCIMWIVIFFSFLWVWVISYNYLKLTIRWITYYNIAFTTDKNHQMKIHLIDDIMFKHKLMHSILLLLGIIVYMSVIHKLKPYILYYWYRWLYRLVQIVAVCNTYMVLQ